MKKYHVYGIGNALVDLEFTVTPDFFPKMNIEKGVMTLIEENRSGELLHHLEKLPTKNAHKRACGGSAANTVIAVSQFGGSSYYSCKVASDDFGKFYLDDLNKNGVKTNPHPTDVQGKTGNCLVMVTPDADRTMNTYLGITSSFSEQELSESALKDSEYVYIEGYLVASPTAHDAAVKAKKLAEKNNIKTALTFSDPNMVKFFKKQFDEIIGIGVDLLFCNESEAMEYTGMNSLKEAREELKKVAKTFVVTLGENGATIFDGTTFVDIEPYKVRAIDTNGAGDMFAGAFLYAITHGHSHAQAGKLASLASSKVVSQFGPRLEWHQTKEIMKELLGV